MTNAADRVAKPGDPDLDFDIDGLTITSVVRDGNHILVGGRGGFGRWRNAQGIYNAAPGDTGAHLTEFTLAVGYANDDLADRVYNTFVDWRDRAVPLRMTGAPGKVSAIIEDADHWLPIVRARRTT